MGALLSLLGGGNSIFAGLLAALIGAIALYLRGRLAGARAERNASRAETADAYKRYLHDIEMAARARSDVGAAGRLPDDRYRRD